MEIKLSIEQIQNLLEVSQLVKDKYDNLSNCIKITLIEKIEDNAKTDKVRFDLLPIDNKDRICFLGTN
jgi:hypothetical protein